MKACRHPASGFFAPHDEAEAAPGALAQRGLLRARMPVFRHEEAPALDKPVSNVVLKNKVADCAIGTAVGTVLGLGARASFALAAANASRFVASPSLALLVMPGWGANWGARVGAEKMVGPLAALVTDAIASGQFVRVAQTLSETATETETAHDVIEAAVAAVKDVSTTRPPVHQLAMCARRAHRAFFHIHHASEPR